MERRLKNQRCPSSDCYAEGTSIQADGTYTTSDGDKRQRYRCGRCGSRWTQRRATILYDLRTSRRTVIEIVQLRTSGYSLREIAQRVGKDKDTVNRIMNRVDGLLSDVSIPPVEDRTGFVQEVRDRVDEDIGLAYALYDYNRREFWSQHRLD